MTKTVTREKIYEEFAKLAQHPLGASLSDLKEIRRRFEFLRSEVDEVEDAVDQLHDEMVWEYSPNKSTLMNLIKELADVQYTLSGFAATFGIDLEEAYRRVHESNMSKFLPDGPTYDANGKVQKGPNYKPPYLGDLV